VKIETDHLTVSEVAETTTMKTGVVRVKMRTSMGAVEDTTMTIIDHRMAEVEGMMTMNLELEEGETMIMTDLTLVVVVVVDERMMTMTMVEDSEVADVMTMTDPDSDTKNLATEVDAMMKKTHLLASAR